MLGGGRLVHFVSSFWLLRDTGRRQCRASTARLLLARQRGDTRQGASAGIRLQQAELLVVDIVNTGVYGRAGGPGGSASARRALDRRRWPGQLEPAAVASQALVCVADSVG
jgi:hypothetical protein